MLELAGTAELSSNGAFISHPELHTIVPMHRRACDGVRGSFLGLLPRLNKTSKSKMHRHN
jgi:hypothetical protein